MIGAAAVVTSTEWMGRVSAHDAMHAVLVADAGFSLVRIF
jgi:hypothetical protein